MIKVLFICHGNICRSPMAEFLMKDLVTRQHISDHFYIASAATSYEEIGNPVYPPARAELKKHGIVTTGKVAVHMEKTDYDKYDYLICMDDWNVRNIMRIIGSDPERKVSKLLSFAGSMRDISDPWYTGDFKTTYEDIMEGLEGLMNDIRRKKLL